MTAELVTVIGRVNDHMLLVISDNCDDRGVFPLIFFYISRSEYFAVENKQLAHKILKTLHSSSPARSSFEHKDKGIVFQ